MTEPIQSPPKAGSLLSNSGWPYRLLHVGTMTSYVRDGDDIYNGVKAPRYNVISYTWGSFVDQAAAQPPLAVRGVHWPIPSIKKEHFSTATFQRAIETVARGLSDKPCDWIWVDIACIPQQHRYESEQDEVLRKQEIGRQADIFHRAQDAFVWLSSLCISDLPRYDGILLTCNDFQTFSNRGYFLSDPTAAIEYLKTMEELAATYEAWIDMFLSHPYFSSLWTLQEMYLRPYACFLFEDGILRQEGTSDPSDLPWTIGAMQAETHYIKNVLEMKKRYIREAEELALQAYGNKISGIGDSILQHMENVLERRVSRGLQMMFDVIDGREQGFPNMAYGLAKFRRATRLEDRIHGIIQVYGLSCNPPLEGDERARLHALEDEFGAKLVARWPLLSQFFIHGLEGNERPRRSWLITQQCKIDPGFWYALNSSRVDSLYQLLEVRGDISVGSSTEGLHLFFKGKAWFLDEALAPPPPSLEDSGVRSRKLFMKFEAPPGYVGRYGDSGLVLDGHVSRAILGYETGCLCDEESQRQATEKICQYYGDDDEPGGRTSEPQRGHVRSSVRVALLASTHRVEPRYFVGIVVAPRRRSEVDSSTAEAAGRPNIVSWERIGVWKWDEWYYGHGQPPSSYDPFLGRHSFECQIE